MRQNLETCLFNGKELVISEYNALSKISPFGKSAEEYFNSIYANSDIYAKISGKHVRRLHIINQNLTEIPQSINDLNQIDSLDLSHNQITKIENLILPNLVNLYLDDNTISIIKGLNLPNLRMLTLIKNNISNIDFLEELLKIQGDSQKIQIVELQGKMVNRDHLYNKLKEKIYYLGI